MDSEAFITKIRNIIADGTSLDLTSIYSPTLPQEGENICAVTLLGGSPIYNLKDVQYYDMTFRVLVRGTINDTATRHLADEIHNSLELKGDIKFDNHIIIHIIVNNLPTFVGQDEELRNLYNITFNLEGK